MKFIRENTQLFLIASLLLGLAPFAPEPHIWGKLKWILGGAEGMLLMDWFDFFMLGSPWVLLIFSLLLKLKSTGRKGAVK
jgi:hypothetical protein